MVFAVVFIFMLGEGKLLRHINRYAVKKEKINNLVFYEVPINKILRFQER